MKRLLLLFAAMCCMMVANAQQFTDANGIKYNVTSTENKTVEVIANKYSGSIVIPATVTNNEVTYSVTGIGESAFKDCKTLTSVTIPDGMVTIGTSAFYGCSQLKSITFPSSVTSIGTSAFTGCDNLIFAKLLGTSVPWTSKTFTNSGENVGGKSFLVPAGEVNAYKNAGWSPTYSSTLAGDELQALKETFLTEIGNAVTAEPRLTADEKSSIETWKTTMMDAADIEATLNARAQAFLVISKRTGMYIVHHLASEPTYTTVGYTQECWEDTETGKLYAEKALTTELNRAMVVTYKKLHRNPIDEITQNDPYSKIFHTSQYEDISVDNKYPFNWAGKIEYLGKSNGDDIANVKFKVSGADVDNARLKCYVGLSYYRLENSFGTSIYDDDLWYSIKIKVNDNVVFDNYVEEKEGLEAARIRKWYPLVPVFEVALPGLKTGDVVTFESRRESSEHPGNFVAALEYTSSNGGDPDAICINADDKRKFKGADDPELTYTTHYPSSSTEELTGISLSRDPGETTGFYTIHASLAEGDNTDNIVINEGRLEIVDGSYHEKYEIRSDGLIYLQNCWQETETGKYYADGQMEHELKRDEAIGYQKLPQNPITATDGFTVKESATYDGVLLDWVAEATYNENGTRWVEFTVIDAPNANTARLAWYISSKSGPYYGYRNFKIYQNGDEVYSESQEVGGGANGDAGVFFVDLPKLNIGDKIRFELRWDARWSNPTVAACLQYTFNPELCFTAKEAGSTVELKRNGATEPVKIQYSTDYANWTTVDFNEATTTGTITLANVGDRVYFRKADEGVASGFSNNQYQYSFAMTGKIAASGNVMSLIDNTCEATTIPGTYCFAKLFEGCTSLTSAPRLPATTLKGDCYWCMFLGCTNLTTPPVLPATTLAASCYSCMFKGCTSLATAPVLPATTLKAWCYSSMFENCTSLTTAQELPVTTLAEACYAGMFKGCTSLASAPELPATTMANQCYSGMFSGCTKLVSAPTLASASLAPTCYRGMFEGCTSLTAAPALPATELKAYCYQNMFSGCTNLKSAPTLAAMKMLDYCYSNMFKDCTSLTTAPALPATTLAFNCYMGMFSGCTKLESAPELPATGMYRECYKDMFKDCTSLTTAPELPATAMINQCYYGMFSGCTNLNHVKVAFTKWTDSSTYIPENWLNGVASTGTFVCPDALDKSKTGASYIPEGWTPVYEVKANNEPNTENHYATFYSGANAYEVPEGVTAYTGVVEESASNPDESVLKLTAIEGGIIPAEEPVILKATKSQVYLPYTTTTSTKSTDNKLSGTDEATTLGANQYALSLGQNGVGFYLWDGKEIAANKAYLTLDGAKAKAFIFQFDDGETTGILKPVMDEKKDSPAYNLNGIRVNDNYKGIVIKNGKKIYNK